ncbi:hypothetical protein DLM_2448 [Aquitalea magnusonii]|uniref:Uncharacterized protein n=1 Tax=Aquitalea magnusonii TaxID=332411 RepID=A0A3G9GF10_9NEIS|nr:hypothetical protein DLM_2448 [Aquitalea magnusonii]
MAQAGHTLRPPAPASLGGKFCRCATAAAASGKNKTAAT